MENILPFLIGATGKIIDDIDDIHLPISSLFKESLKTINVCLFTLTGQNDFLFSFSTLILSVFGAGIDTDYWKSFIFVSLILCIIYFSPIDNWPLFILIISVILVSTIFEENQFPEEFSIKKLITRLLGFIVFLGVLIIPGTKICNYSFKTTNINYIRKLILIALGGLFISIIFQIYFLWFSNPVLQKEQL